MIEDGVDYCDGCGWYRPECKCRPASSLSPSPTPDTTAARAPEPVDTAVVRERGYAWNQEALALADALDETRAALAQSTARVQELEGEHVRLREALAKIHTPGDEEAELWVDDPGHDERFPFCPAVAKKNNDCDGHSFTIQVCSECGYTHDGETPSYRGWPCPTIKAMGR